MAHGVRLISQAPGAACGACALKPGAVALMKPCRAQDRKPLPHPPRGWFETVKLLKAEGFPKALLLRCIYWPAGIAWCRFIRVPGLRVI
jgi:hypothetical protein